MSTEYQLQIDGKPKFYYTSIGKKAIEEYLEWSRLKPNSSVQIVRVSTDVIINNYNYSLMKTHFKAASAVELLTSKNLKTPID